MRLGEVDDPLVIAEIERQQLGVAVDAEPLDDEPVEVPDEEIREEEAGGLVIGELGEILGTSEELVTMGAADALDAFLDQDLP